jgi:hypothetical protein
MLSGSLSGVAALAVGGGSGLSGERGMKREMDLGMGLTRGDRVNGPVGIAVGCLTAMTDWACVAVSDGGAWGLAVKAWVNTDVATVAGAGVITANAVGRMVLHTESAR